MKFWCRHRWSNVKRWQVGNQFFVIQRCRRCERWVRKTLELINGKLEIVTETYTEMNKAFKSPEMIQPLEAINGKGEGVNGKNPSSQGDNETPKNPRSTGS